MVNRTIYAYESAAAGLLARPCGSTVWMSQGWHVGAKHTGTNGKRQFTVPARRPSEPTD